MNDNAKINIEKIDLQQRVQVSNIIYPNDTLFDKEDDNKLNLEDEITSGSMLLNNGKVCNEIVKQFLDKG